MKWTSALATGHEIIDEQHRSLFDCRDALVMAATEQRTLLAVYSMTRLKRYVREHFDTEEAVMKQSGFPKLEEHLAEHERFRIKMADIQGKAIILDVSLEMVEFLNDWLVSHIARSDMEYARHLEN